jgi:uncharacterized membrane protein
MDSGSTTIGGIVIPSTDPAFVGVVVGVHIPLGIACVVMGASAMLSRKGRGRHSRFGTIFFWCLLALFVSATFLSIMRWPENYHLFILGAVSFGCAWFGRSALQLRWPNWIRLHIAGMSLSYVFMLIAFYVDNGKQLPVWKDPIHLLAVASSDRSAADHLGAAVAPVGYSDEARRTSLRATAHRCWAAAKRLLAFVSARPSICA